MIMQIELNVEAGGDRLRLSFDLRGKRIIARLGVPVQHRSLQTVAVADQKGLRLLLGVAQHGIDTPREDRVEQAARPFAARRELPDLVACAVADARHSGFPTRSPLGHGLEQLNRVICMLFQIAVAGREQFGETRATRDLERRTAPGERHG